MTTLEKSRATGDPAVRSLRGVYGISVMSELSGVGPQTLRLRSGHLEPDAVTVVTERRGAS